MKRASPSPVHEAVSGLICAATLTRWSARLATGLLLLKCVSLNTVAIAQEYPLSPTPPDVEGPFYPVTRQTDEDNNLLQVVGQERTAEGEVILLSGRVIDIHGNPVRNAVVEIWQTDSNGLYKDRRDASPGERDPLFQYWGKATCGADGSYSFTTLVPGEYYPRPAHIHFKVWVNDSVRLTSQLYFNREDDPGVSNRPRYRTPDPLTVPLTRTGKGIYKARFRIILQPSSPAQEG